MGFNMNFLKYRNAREYLDDTGLSVEQGLIAVENELDKLKGKAKT